MSEKRLAVISLIIENRDQSPEINSILSEFGDYVVGRMGVPYKERGVSVICVIVDAPRRGHQLNYRQNRNVRRCVCKDINE